MKKTATKERPILFSAPMVRAILNGHKTQTRRIVKPQPRPWEEKGQGIWSRSCGRAKWTTNERMIESTNTVTGEKTSWTELLEVSEWLRESKCPYGRVGDRLWVKETFATSVVDPEGGTFDDDPDNYDFAYRADGEGIWTNAAGKRCSPRWISPIFMPRIGSRITLEITDVRVQRVHDASEEDARAEGFTPQEISTIGSSVMVDTAYSQLSEAWDRVNGKGSWEANPWIWCISFKDVKP